MGQPDDDEFGLSSSDEAELLNLDSRASLKRKSEDALSSESKRRRAHSIESPAMKVAHDVLHKHFRMKNFRLKQEAAIGRLLNGESAVVVFPTGM